jgi:phytoene desaturase
MKPKVIVIGAGVAGLAAAIRLACQGHAVTVFEANAFVGGKINSQRFGDYRFDMGPSVFTGPEYLEELYTLCGKDFATFKHRQLAHSFAYFYPDGLRMHLPAEKSLLVQELASKLDEDPEVLKKYLDKAARNYAHIAPLFIETSLHRFSHWINSKLFRALLRIPKYKLTQTMHRENQQRFRNPQTVQLFDRYATYNGSSPYEAPAMLNMISNLELNTAPFLPEKGMVQIADALYSLACGQGVTFHLQEKVEEILLENEQVRGIRTNRGTYDAGIVVSNMDVSFTYEKLLSGVARPRKILAQEKSSSAVVFYWGIRRQFRELDVHNIFFSANYEAEFTSIFKDKELPVDPTIYINITSKAIPADAPAGCENWFVMVNAPIIEGQDWSATVLQLRERVIRKINSLLHADIEPLIEVEHHLDPVQIEQRYSGKQGSIYGNASNNAFAAFYRHANYSKKIRGLYFAGVTVHPGGGIPLALNSAKIAAECIRTDYR